MSSENNTKEKRMFELINISESAEDAKYFLLNDRILSALFLFESILYFVLLLYSLNFGLTEKSYLLVPLLIFLSLNTMYLAYKHFKEYKKSKKAFIKKYGEKNIKNITKNKMNTKYFDKSVSLKMKYIDTKNEAKNNLDKQKKKVFVSLLMNIIAIYLTLRFHYFGIPIYILALIIITAVFLPVAAQIFQLQLMMKTYNSKYERKQIYE